MFEDEMIFEDDPSGDDIVFEGDVPDDVSGGAFFPDDALFNGMPTFVMLFFVIVIGIFLFSIFKGIGTWSKNEQSPRLSVKAKITGKRPPPWRSCSRTSSPSHVYNLLHNLSV
ncbi:Protein of unknown function [Priestia megaterium]|nr:Protein of unknown function [Priestia megaterium]